MKHIQTFYAVTEKKYLNIKLHDKKGKKLLNELSEIDHLIKKLKKEYDDKLTQINKYEDELNNKHKETSLEVTGD